MTAPEAVSQILIVASPPADTTRCPSGLNAQRLTSLAWPARVRRRKPVAASQILIVRSRLADAISRPSGLNAQPLTRSSWPSRVHCALPVRASQISSVSLWLADTTRSPSGLKPQSENSSEWPVRGTPRVATSQLWPARVRRRAPVPVSQILIVQSSLADAISCPSGLNTQPRTAPAWPARVRRRAPVPVSQIFSVASSLADAISRPSGLNAQPRTAPWAAAPLPLREQYRPDGTGFPLEPVMQLLPGQARIAGKDVRFPYQCP